MSATYVGESDLNRTLAGHQKPQR